MQNMSIRASAPAPTIRMGGRLTWRRTSSKPSGCLLRLKAERNDDAGGQPGGGEKLKTIPPKEEPDDKKTTLSPLPAPINPSFSSPLLRAPLSGGLERNIRHHLELPLTHVSARNLMEHALYGDLVTVMSPMEHRRAGWPVASLVDFATDSEGTPIFSLSPMSMHARNVNADSRCSLVVDMPGWRGLASARITLFGTVKRVPDELQDLARGLFKKKHAEENASYGTSKFPMYILADIQDVYFVGGYGTVKWVNVKDYLSCSPDKLCDRRFGDPLHQINLLNEYFRGAIPKIFEGCTKGKIIGLDSRGIDLRLQLHDEGHLLLQRVRFHNPAGNIDEVKNEIAKILKIGFKSSGPCTSWKCK